MNIEIITSILRNYRTAYVLFPLRKHISIKSCSFFSLINIGNRNLAFHNIDSFIIQHSRMARTQLLHFNSFAQDFSSDGFTVLTISNDTTSTFLVFYFVSTPFPFPPFPRYHKHRTKFPTTSIPVHSPFPMSHFLFPQ